MSPKKVGSKLRTPASLLPGAEEKVGVTADLLTGFYVLDSIKQFGPQKFKQLHVEGVPFPEVVANPSQLTLGGKRGDAFRSQLASVTPATHTECRQRAIRQINSAYELGASIVTYGSPFYPRNVYASNYPVAVLYVRGARDVLQNARAVACVGSRGIRSPYREFHERFAEAACASDHTVVSGFALGADTIGHEVARKVGGRTICCMPGGLDRPFPPENVHLWEVLLNNSGAVFVSEFPFGTGAVTLTLRKRNKLIVAFALGVLISQTAEKGGAMNAYRFAREQRKPVATFAPDGADDTSGNRFIVERRQDRDAVFPTAPDEGAYQLWLQQLSSSI